MNLDERITDYLIDCSLDHEDIHNREPIKQLIRDVVKEITPERIDHEKALKGFMKVPDSELLVFDRGYNKAVDHMESNARKLGL